MNPRFTFSRKLIGQVLLALALTCPRLLWAQWETQSLLIKPGWTAVYLNVDASYTNLDYLVGSDPSNPITQIWIWQTSPTMQAAISPQNPLPASSQWQNWARLGTGLPSTINAVAPNAAYLVYSAAATNYFWQVRGRPVPPQYAWSSAGLNLVGFPTPAGSPPMLDRFFSLAVSSQGTPTVYQYPGGNLGAANPARVFAFHTTAVNRGQAFWVQPTSAVGFSGYYGPFVASFTSSRGVDFGDSLSQYSFTLQNTTATNVTVTLSLLPSEFPPAGQPASLGAPPLIVRGALNPTNLTYAYTALALTNSEQWVLPPAGQSGASITIVLGLNRYAMGGPAGSLYSGILRLTDSLGLEQVDVAVGAQTAASGGLWVGSALVSQVRNYLKIFQRDTNNDLVINRNGAYIVTGVTTNFGAVAAPFPLRLIIHNDGANSTLLERVYYGFNQQSNPIVATSQSALDPAQLGTARRISAPHLPWTSANKTWPLAGAFGPGGTLTTTTDLPYDDQAANPFLHTFHPDHNNLDTTFTTKLPQGYHSYEISRQITLNFTPPGNDFASLTSAGRSASGNYLETITVSGVGGASRNFDVSGSFSMNRISAISTLTTQ